MTKYVKPKTKIAIQSTGRPCNQSLMSFSLGSDSPQAEPNPYLNRCQVLIAGGSAPASDELRKNPIIGIVWLLRPGLRRCDPRYLNEVRFTPWLSLWRNSREILNHGCKSLRSDFHRAGERMIDDHNGQQPGKDQD